MASTDLEPPLDSSRSQSPRIDGTAHLENGFEDDHLEADEHLADEEDDADLFGDDDAGAQAIEVGQRRLDDSELDSADDEGRVDRLEDTVEDEQYDSDGARRQDVKYLTMDLARVKAPEVDDDELYLLNLPPFLGLSDSDFVPETFKPPERPHDGQEPAIGKFSAYSTAATTMYWRHDPLDQNKLQSNSRIIRWSDGSLTLQMASTPKDQYRISTTALRQSYAKKNKPSLHNDYDPNKDAQAYLAIPHAADDVVQITAPFSAAMKILPTGEQTDESVIRLQNSLAAANATYDPFAAIKHTKEDPELAKKAAELAEKDIMRAKRRIQNAEEKQFTRRDKVLGRSGLVRGAGLSVAGLEDEDGMPATTRPKKSVKPKRNRRGDIYSADEDEGYPRGRTKEDEYDREMDFMAGSDEEPEIYDDDDAPGEDDDPDVDDLVIEGRDTVVAEKTRRAKERGARDGTPKRSRDRDEDVLPATSGSPHAGRKKRRVIEDDDDE